TLIMPASQNGALAEINFKLFFAIGIIAQYLPVVFKYHYFNVAIGSMEFHKGPITFNRTAADDNGEIMVFIRLVIGIPMGMAGELKIKLTLVQQRSKHLPAMKRPMPIA